MQGIRHAVPIFCSNSVNLVSFGATTKDQDFSLSIFCLYAILTQEKVHIIRCKSHINGVDMQSYVCECCIYCICRFVRLHFKYAFFSMFYVFYFVIYINVMSCLNCLHYNVLRYFPNWLEISMPLNKNSLQVRYTFNSFLHI